MARDLGNNSHAMTSSANRSMHLHRRPDLIVERQSYQGRHYWVVKDPISLKYYRFEAEEYALLEMLDGHSSPDQIKRRFDYRFAPQKITLKELSQFTGMLYRSSLVISDLPHQGIELKKRGDKNRRQERRQSLTNILSIRYKGFDPDRLLGAMNRWTQSFFTWPAFVIALLIGLGALALIVTQFETFQNKLPSFNDFFAARNWIWLALVMAFTKVCHEFGHALACKRFGGECHEMGVMLLVLTPCLYVNVSDSWLLNNKWHRAFIAAAGMYVELVLASIAVFVWWFSTPGMINQLALNTIFISSVSTLLFNANPLLRYDGYYILSDLLEIPNLRSKATSILQRASGQWLLGIEARPDPFLPTKNRWMFAIFSVAAASYRWLITISIFWFVYRVLEPYGFKIIGQIIALSALYGLLGVPLVKLYQFFSIPGRLSSVKPNRAAITGVVLAGIFGAVLLIPIPHFVRCSFYIQAHEPQNVYVDVAGTLEEILIEPNRFVNEGDPILRLSSHSLQTQMARLKTNLELAKVRRVNMEQGARIDRTSGDRIESATAAVDAAQVSYRKRQLDQDRLIVRAPTSGYFLSPPRIDAASSRSSELPSWHGTPLEQRNLGATLKQSTFVGQIVSNMKEVDAVLAIDQSDIEFINPQQRVELSIRQFPGQRFDSITEQISPAEMKSVPKSLSSRFGGDIITRTSPAGKDVPASTKYLVNVRLTHSDELIFPGTTGIARIRTGSQTVGQRIWRLASRTFQFEL